MRPRITKKNGLAALFLLMGGLSSAIGHGDHSAAPPTGGSNPESQAAPSDVSEEQAFNAMGYAMAKQLRLDIGFTEAQVEQIVAGVRALALGEDAPANFEAALPRAQQLYTEKIMAVQAKEAQEREAKAKENQAKAEKFLAEIDAREGVEKSESGLRYEILEAGDTEKKPSQTDRVRVHYEGKLIDGSVFDSSYKKGQPATFAVAGVVRGFGEGLQLIGEGGKIRLYIPSDLGYGNNPPSGDIGPGDLLIFEVELQEILPPPQRPTGAPTGRPGNIPPPPNMRPPGPPPGPPPSTPPPGPPPGVGRPTTPPPPPPGGAPGSR